MECTDLGWAKTIPPGGCVSLAERKGVLQAPKDLEARRSLAVPDPPAGSQVAPCDGHLELRTTQEEGSLAGAKRWTAGPDARDGSIVESDLSGTGAANQRCSLRPNEDLSNWIPLDRVGLSHPRGHLDDPDLVVDGQVVSVVPCLGQSRTPSGAIALDIVSCWDLL